MTRYVYKNKKTGAKVYSNHPISSPNLELVREIRDGKIKSNRVIKK